MDYNEGEIQAAIAEGEKKLAAKRNKRRRDQQRFFAACIALGVLLPLCVVAGAVASRAPSAPSLVVTWPKPKVKQVLAPGQTLLVRTGQPFSISVTNADDWNVTWKAAGIESEGSEFTWAPAEEKSALTASCRANVTDWKRFFSWTWPHHEISVQAVSDQKVGDYSRTLDAGIGGTWIYPHVFAKGNISFDERALPLLSGAIQLVPQNELSNQLANVASDPTPQLWQIVADFDGSTNAAGEAPDATFAMLYAPDISETLPQIAGKIVKTAPDASVKFVLRLDKDPDEGIIRLAFDGKKERRAWVRRTGETAGGPFTGWEDGDVKSSLAPILPRR